MTGIEFMAKLKAAGYNQTSFAEIMGVHRTVIVRQVESDKVKNYWVYALAGAIAGKSANEVAELVMAVY